MTATDPQCSPPDLETTTNLVWKGANTHSTANGKSIPPLPALAAGKPPNGGPDGGYAGRERTRSTPIIWRIQQTLTRRGLVACVIRGGTLVLPDIIAWDAGKTYFIVVRRSRTTLTHDEIAARYTPLITHLRAVPLPKNGTIQLWIQMPLSCRIYEILQGGIISRGQE